MKGMKPEAMIGFRGEDLTLFASHIYFDDSQSGLEDEDIILRILKTIKCYCDIKIVEQEHDIAVAKEAQYAPIMFYEGAGNDVS